MTLIIRQGSVPWWRRLIAVVLRAGPIPKHVAIIMDGNRRFARKNSIERAEGHLKGFDKMAEMLDWCLDLGILEVTVYAFSIENFNRTKDEVDGLMELARSKFLRLREEQNKLDEYGVCIRVWGNISLLPEDIQRIVAEVVSMTSHNNKVYFNVCLAYTSREEITTAMREVAEGVHSGMLHPDDITASLLNSCMYSGESAPLDMLVRTSGEIRLSDFLLWQSTNSIMSFVEVLWPDFSIWHLYAAVLQYQRNIAAMQAKHKKEPLPQTEQENPLLASVPCSKESDSDQRISHFLQHLSSKRKQHLDSLHNNVPSGN